MVWGHKTPENSLFDGKGKRRSETNATVQKTRLEEVEHDELMGDRRPPTVSKLQALEQLASAKWVRLPDWNKFGLFFNIHTYVVC